MNYIKQLQARIAAQDAALASFRDSLHQFRVFLHSDKFVGVDADGERKDWISTGDVLSWIRQTYSNATIAEEQAHVEKQ